MTEQPTYGQGSGSPYGQAPPYGQVPPYGPPPNTGNPPPYGQPFYGPPAGYAYPRRTNVLAILTLIFAFIFAPAAIPLGVVARRQIRQSGEDGDSLALAGLIVGIVFTTLWVLMLILFLGLFATALQVTTSSGTARALPHP